MMDLAMNFDADECLVTAMFDKGNRNDTMEAIDHIIPFLKGDADMIGLVCNTIRKLFCMSDEENQSLKKKYQILLMNLGNRNDTMEAIDHIIPFLKGDADMIGLVCNTIRKLFCMSDEGYEVFLMDLEEYKMELEEEEEE